MNPWEMLTAAMQDPKIPFKLEVGVHTIARKAPKDGEVDVEIEGTTTVQPPQQRQRYMQDQNGIIWDMLAQTPVSQVQR
jgi:hypothetical protein